MGTYRGFHSPADLDPTDGSLPLPETLACQRFEHRARTSWCHINALLFRAISPRPPLAVAHGFSYKEEAWQWHA